MAQTIKIAEYLFTRLHQLGLRSVHGVPGDYNLTLLDYVEPSGLHWVGNCNELNAGYAADGYARIKGIGAIITTFGVGELSAINAIAGAYCERVPLVHIVGTPDRDTQDARLKVHHTFNDGDFCRFAQMHAYITVAQANLMDPALAPEQIDAVLKQCILHSRPVYIQVPADMVDVAIVSSSLISVPLSQTLELTISAASHDVALAAVLEKIKTATRPMILVDGEIRALRITENVQNIVDITEWPTWTTGFAKGLIDETASNVHGVYRGSYDPKAKAFVDGSDLVLCFGPHFSSTNSYDSTSIPPKAVSIIYTDNEIRVGQQTFRDIPVNFAVAQLQETLRSVLRTELTHKPTCLDLPLHPEISFSSLPEKQAITQDRMWSFLANFIRSGDIVMGETGTAGYGVQKMRLPRHTRVFAPVTWLSIGYMLAAAQGAALAQRDLIASSSYHGLEQARTLLFIGDGSFQMTVQELGTIIREELDVIIFLLNNDGYTIERCIHGLEEHYNDLGRWRYTKAPHFLGAADDVYVVSVKTWGDLQRALEAAAMTNGRGLRMVELLLDREDVPEGPLLDLMLDQKKDSRPLIT